MPAKAVNREIAAANPVPRAARTRVGIHMLRGMNSANPNRSIDGSPKVTWLGGVRRGFVSAAAENAPRRDYVRAAMAELSNLVSAERSRNGLEFAARELIAAGITPAEAYAVALAVRNFLCASDADDREADGTGAKSLVSTNQMVFVSIAGISKYMVEAVKSLRDRADYAELVNADAAVVAAFEYRLASLLAGRDAEGKAAMKAYKDHVGDFVAVHVGDCRSAAAVEKANALAERLAHLNAKERAAEIEAVKGKGNKLKKADKDQQERLVYTLFPLPDGRDVSAREQMLKWDHPTFDTIAFGRMGQTHILPDITGCIATAPSITVGEYQDFDNTFSVREERPLDVNNRGAAYFGKKPQKFMSGLFYNYTGVDIDQMLRNATARFPRDILRTSYGHYIRAIMDAHPKSMDRATGNHPLVGYMLAIVGSNAGMSLAQAFESPVPPADRLRSVSPTEVAVERLLKMATCYRKHLGATAVIAYDPTGKTPDAYRDGIEMFNDPEEFVVNVVGHSEIA